MVAPNAPKTEKLSRNDVEEFEFATLIAFFYIFGADAWQLRNSPDPFDRFEKGSDHKSMLICIGKKAVQNGVATWSTCVSQMLSHVPSLSYRVLKASDFVSSSFCSPLSDAPQVRRQAKEFSINRSEPGQLANETDKIECHFSFLLLQ